MLWDGENPYDLQFSPGGRLLALKYGGSPFGLGWFDPQYEPTIWLWSARSGPWSVEDYKGDFGVGTPAGDRKMIPTPAERDFHFSADGAVAQDLDPDWSPNGKRIIFSRLTAAGPTVRITNAATAGPSPLARIRPGRSESDRLRPLAPWRAQPQRTVDLRGSP